MIQTDNLVTPQTYQATSKNERTGKPYSLKQIYKLIEDGKIKSVKIDGRIFVVTN